MNRLLFAERMRTERAKRDVTQDEMAEFLGIDRTAISQYESGSRTPTIDRAAIIAEKLGVSIDWLMGLHG